MRHDLPVPTCTTVSTEPTSRVGPYSTATQQYPRNDNFTYQEQYNYYCCCVCLVSPNQCQAPARTTYRPVPYRTVPCRTATPGTPTIDKLVKRKQRSGSPRSHPDDLPRLELEGHHLGLLPFYPRRHVEIKGLDVSKVVRQLRRIII